jgi:pimeloyl-ACP methyl ester carboxylesterase
MTEPMLPHGRRLLLPERGTTFVREVAGPRGAPTLLLLHGWVASGALNWYRNFEPLSEHFRIIAPDVRGHARGLRTRRIFRLADCADDAAETLLALDTGPVIVAGYSMGGPIAQLLWRRHRDLVSGLVLCATAPGFAPISTTRFAYQSWMLGWAGAARLASWVPNVPAFPGFGRQPTRLPAWVAAELQRHDWRMIVEAGQSLSTYYAGQWIGEVDVPTTVVCTARDRAVRPDLQRAMANAIRGASIVEVDDGHLACRSESFNTPLLRACLQVADRARAVN